MGLRSEQERRPRSELIGWIAVGVERFESALWQTSSLLLSEGTEAVLVDPAVSANEVERMAARARELGVEVTHVLATHSDWDHVCGIAAFPAATATSTMTAAPSKVWVCHHTGSWKHPYRLIHISTHALQAHLRHGDVTPGANNSCPTTQPTGAKTHGHGNGQGASPSGGGNDDQNEAPETNDD